MPPKNKSTRSAFALALRKWRATHGDLTMVAAARKFDVPYRTWQDWEAGVAQPRGFARRLIIEKLTKGTK